MSGPSKAERSGRSVEREGTRFRATVAWRREASGHGLLYFLPLDGGNPAADDRRDRRALLEPGRGLGDLSEEELAAKLEDAVPLTVTERRLRAPDGRLWLAQSVGPVWADEDPAEGSTGLLFTSLEGPAERLRGPGAHAGELPEEELIDLWRRAGSDDAEGTEDDGDGAEAAGGDGGP